tara:strand:+ start:153 stop:320 length:168 start_codon:yes stop_codon:yes gene_type:complete
MKEVMDRRIEHLLDKLKHQAEKLDNRYKAMIDICKDSENVVEELQHDIHKLEKEL